MYVYINCYVSEQCVLDGTMAVSAVSPSFGKCPDFFEISVKFP